MLRNVKDHLKSFLRPIRTKLLYPEVKFGYATIANNKCDFGKDIKIHEHSIISSSKIDSYTYIGGNSFIKNSTIGKFCSIAPEVRIGLGIHPVEYISTYPGFYSNKASGAFKFHHDKTIQEHLPIIIGNDVWIGTRAMIMDGVTIGDGAVVAAGCVVTKDITPYSIVGGVPARLIKKRFTEDQIKMLLEYKWWDKEIEFIRENAQLFLLPERFLQFINEHK
jgi:acetyltransferase-like isoleucine patch superfamily enzyme